jgi:hypothetical protein
MLFELSMLSQRLRGAESKRQLSEMLLTVTLFTVMAKAFHRFMYIYFQPLSASHDTHELYCSVFQPFEKHFHQTRDEALSLEISSNYSRVSFAILEEDLRIRS